MSQNPRPDAEQPRFSDLVDLVDGLWPFSLTEEWDRTGPVAGRMQRPVSRVLVAVDPVAEVVDEALAGGYDALLTHHPLLLRGVSSVSDEGYKGELLTRLIEGGCGLIAAHTNADQPEGGVSDLLAQVLGLRDMEPLVPARGNDDGAAPAGIGRVGTLEQPMALAAFARRVAGALPSVAGGVRVAGDAQAEVQRVALCGGAGDSLFDEVRASGADVYVTSDLRHHPASEAREEARGGTPYLIDTAHFASEWVWVPFAAEALTRAAAERGWEIEARASEAVTDPWDFVLVPDRR